MVILYLFTSLPVSIERGSPSSCLGTSCTSELVFALRAGGFDLRARPGPHASPRDAVQTPLLPKNPRPQVSPRSRSPRDVVVDLLLMSWISCFATLPAIARCDVLQLLPARPTPPARVRPNPRSTTISSTLRLWPGTPTQISHSRTCQLPMVRAHDGLVQS